MDYMNLGRSGLKVSRICLGCMSYGDPASGHHGWVLDEAAARPFIARALELGVTFFDTANMYSLGKSEEILGRAIRDFGHRDALVISSKVFFPMGKGDPNAKGLSRKSIMRELEGSLRRLGTDYLDLYFMHRWDEATPIDETLEALNDAVKSGKVRYIGASSMFAWQFAKALGRAELRGWSRFVAMQPHYNLLYREEEREMLPLCEAEGLGVVPWSPLARGRLARPKSSGATARSESDSYGRALYAASEEADAKVLERLGALAEARGAAPASLALAWLLGRKAIVAPIVGATKLSHLDDAVAALGIRLSEEEALSLEEPYVPHRIAGISY